MDNIHELARTHAWTAMMLELSDQLESRKQDVLLKARTNGNVQQYIGIHDGFSQCIDVLQALAKRGEDGK